MDLNCSLEQVVLSDDEMARERTYAVDQETSGWTSFGLSLVQLLCCTSIHSSQKGRSHEQVLVAAIESFGKEDGRPAR